MVNKTKRWEILNKRKVPSIKGAVAALLKNRKIKTVKQKKEFINPPDPMSITIKELGISATEIRKAVERIKKAKKYGEHVIVYGDYDADGITGTATLWETLHALGIFVLPHIPERFSEGYGLNFESVRKLKEGDPALSLVITVDHGITAGEKVAKVKEMGVDMIITDHHQKEKTLPKPLALIYTTKIGGSALAWFFAREIVKKFKVPESKFSIHERLQLATIGTIADQLPLIGPNRSIAKYGLEELSDTKRPGLLALFNEAGISEIGPYEVGYIIAPRINAMGRLKHGLDSLRLLCTGDKVRGLKIAAELGKTNLERQRIVDEVVVHALGKTAGEPPAVFVLADEKYHEGVIGLAAAKLVEKFYRPAIVMSKNRDVTKASARSIAGFNIIEVIRRLDKYYIEGGGHPMAAGFSIRTENIGVFTRKINRLAKEILTDEMLQRRLRIDCEIEFALINFDLIKDISLFEPTGLGNPEPVFVSRRVELLEARTVGREARHIKLRLRQGEQIFDSIYFGGGEIYSELTSGSKLDVVYALEKNVWNGNESIQLKIKDLKVVS
jgi:single-stranded-DNA-specific exonuclease